jgi:PAS domain S-box-containing protein
MSAPTKIDLQDEITRQEQEIESLRAALKEEAAARRRAEVQRDRFFSLSAEMLCVTDLDGHLIEASPAFEKTLGQSRQRLLKQPFMNFIHPEDKAHARTEMQNLAAGLPAVGLDLRWRTADGGYKWLAWTAVPAPEEGLVYAIARDTSERRRLEEELSEERHLLYALIDSLPERIYVKDAEGHYLLSNLAHRRFLDLPSPEAVQGKTVFDFFPKSLAAKYYVDDQLVILEGQTLVNREEPIAGQDGELRWTSTTKVLLRDRRGRVAGLICSSRDITDKERLQELKNARNGANSSDETEAAEAAPLISRTDSDESSPDEPEAQSPTD